VMRYHLQWYSSAVASGGGFIICRSVWEGLRSIMERLLCSVSRTMSRVTPVGRGVIVVNSVLAIVADC